MNVAAEAWHKVGVCMAVCAGVRAVVDGLERNIRLCWVILESVYGDFVGGCLGSAAAP